MESSSLQTFKWNSRVQWRMGLQPTSLEYYSIRDQFHLAKPSCNDNMVSNDS